ncbi:hypothetical protein V5O48_001147 [Marasmius crinis-equi]|uniref:AB hydrolase-1 domain-containing protein n=1 Tax=Marasmius crinis-equi TaxID=585013 RepID=A0ABR3FZ98_9AGAR
MTSIRIRNFLLIAASLLYAQAADGLSVRDDSNSTWTELSWDTLQPSKDLQWVDCYSNGLQCARLQVPLNYHDADGGQSAIIALTRLPANVSHDSPDYRGPILFNPGGPGESGVDLIRLKGPTLRQTLGPQFDLVGFDPRGVQRSFPRFEFYKTPVDRLLNYHPPTELNNSLTDTVASYWAETKIMGSLAYERGKEYMPYLNTDHSARDMLRIVQAHGREKIQYWGFSYGSVLGYTFASMFPDKVERLVIDGVVDIDLYYQTKWLESLEDVEKTLQWFFDSCHQAGRDHCAFYEDSPEAIRNKLEGIYANLINHPIPVQSPTNGSHYTVVDYAQVRGLIFNALYQPFKTWSGLAEGLQALAEGNATEFYTKMLEAPPFECDCDLGKHKFDKNPEALSGYACNDGDPVPPDFESALKHYEESVKLSSFGSIWAGIRIACNGWSSDIPKADFRGPITGNTSFPLLMIGNTADPVTPLSA